MSTLFVLSLCFPVTIKKAPEVRARCNETQTTEGDKIVFQHSFQCDGDLLFIAVEGNTKTGQIELTHFKWVEHDEER